jgi:hypothetical protein
MARDPMRVLHAVRLRDIEAARHALAACLLVETGVLERIRTIGDTVQRDRAAYSTMQEAHRFQEMFMLRQRTVEAERQAAEGELAAVRIRTAAARAAVVEARTAAEAVETLMTDRQAAAGLEAARREQHTLDDMARTRPDTAFRSETGWTR